MAREALPPTAKLLSSWKVSNEHMLGHRRCRYLPSELPHVERHGHCTRFCGAGAFQHLLELCMPSVAPGRGREVGEKSGKWGGRWCADRWESKTVTEAQSAAR